jgi:hypothetical protein
MNSKGNWVSLPAYLFHQSELKKLVQRLEEVKGQAEAGIASKWTKQEEEALIGLRKVILK